MTLLLAHYALLALLSYGAARRLVRDPVDRLLAAALLFWGNIVALGLGLSCLEKLSDPAWLFRGSLGLGALTWLLVRRIAPEPLPTPVPAAEKRSVLLVIAVFGTLVPLLLGNLAIAAGYEPNNYDSMTYHLPRVVYYLGHNSLAHFETADFRQVYYPFNFNLLQLVCFAYDAPNQSINFLNVAMWVITGLGVYRISRLAGAGFNAALAAAWLALTSLEILAQATSTIIDMPAGAALLCTVVFALRWRESRRARDAFLAAVGVSMSVGTKLTVVFFGPALVALLVVFAYRHWRRAEVGAYFRGIRAWIAPGVVAAILGAPFIAYNLAATGEMMTHRMDFTLNKPFSVLLGLHTAKAYLVQLFVEPLGRFTFDTGQIQALNEWFSRHVFFDWNEAYVFSPLYTIPPDLNEDHVFFGFAGPLFLICAVVCLARDWRLQRPMGWIALLGLGWFAFYFATNKWSLYNQRYFVPPLALLAPCAAAVWDAGRNRFKRFAFWAVAATSLWFSGYYLLNNTIRPVPFPRVERPKILPTLPPTLTARLAKEPRINISSYGTNERIYPLLHLGHGQRVTSGSGVDPEKYNVFSYWGTTRNVIYSNLEYYSSYTMVPVPTKRTAGAELLGTVEGSADDFDYLGLPPHAADTPSTRANRNVAVFIEYEARSSDPVRLRGGRLGVIGLNPADGARMEISADMVDGSRVVLLTTTQSTVGKATLDRPFKRLLLHVTDVADGRTLGRGEVPFTVRVGLPKPTVALDPSLRFSTDLISGETPRGFTVSGLAPPEGPYEQWELPRFRWSKQPAVRFQVAADEKLQRFLLTFDVRLQARDAAVLDVVHNGRVVATIEIRGHKVWTRRVLQLLPDPGENIIELKDHPVDGVAPPADSLYFLYRTLRLEGLVTPS